jgi:sulfonate transport system substrate-binding protein
LARLKLTAVLEKRLPSTTVTWVEFPAGPQILEALSVGSVDLGATGDSPPVFAQAAGKDLVYVGAEPPKPDSSAILVKPDAPLRSLADLKGRRVAFQKGSSAHFLTVQALAKAGLQWSDIQPVYLAPADARAAFERGSVDAWAIWDPYYAAAEIDGQVRVLATSRGLTNNNTFYLATRALAGQEAVLRQILAALVDTDRYVQQNRQEAAKRFADFAGLGLATVLRVLERRQPSPVAPLTAALVAEQQRVADAFAELKLIPRPIRVADALPAGQAARLALVSPR